MKKSLLIVLVGLGLGYVLGARAGRERYDLIVEKVTGVWEDPRVAKAAPGVVKAAPGVIADRAKDVASTAKDVADRTVSTTRRVVDRTSTAATTAAATAANRVGEARDSVLDVDEHSDDDEQ